MTLTTNNVATPAASPVLGRTKAMPPQETGNTDTPSLYHRCANGKMVKIEVSRDEHASNFGWAAGTFLRGGYNPADAAAMDTLMQAGRRDVGNFNGDMDRADLRTGDVLVFRDSHGNVERAACYEGKGVFSHAGVDGIPHFETRADFAASHADALKHGATIMRETNPYRHRALAESVRPLVDELHGMDSSSRRMSSWPPKLTHAVEGCVFDHFGNYSAHAHYDKTTPPGDDILLPKEEFMAQLRKDVANMNDEERPDLEDVEKHADEIYATSKVQRRLSWTRSRFDELRKEYAKDETLPPREINARVNSDARYLDYVRRGGVANCQEASAVLSSRLREAGGDVGVEVISQKVQDGTDHVYVAIGRDAGTDIRTPWNWNSDVVIVDGWYGRIGSVGEMFPPSSTVSTLSSDAPGLRA